MLHHLSHQGSNLPYDPAIPPLSIHPEKAAILKDICTPMFSAMLFTIARTWKQPRCPSTHEWIKKMWHIYTTEHYSALKKNKSVSSSEVDEPRACYTEWNKSEREKQMYFNTDIWNLEKCYWWTYLQGRNGDADEEDGPVDIVGEGDSGTNGKRSSDIHLPPCIK